MLGSGIERRNLTGAIHVKAMKVISCGYFLDGFKGPTFRLA
jgi:hypothetical protein